MVSIATIDGTARRVEDEGARRRALDGVRNRVALVPTEGIKKWDVQAVNDAVRFLLGQATSDTTPEKVLEAGLGELQGIQLSTFCAILSLLFELNILPNDSRIQGNPMGLIIRELDRIDPARADAVRRVFNNRSRTFSSSEELMRDRGDLPIMHTVAEAESLLAFLDEYARDIFGFDFRIGKKMEVIFSEAHGMRPDDTPTNYVQQIRIALRKLEQVLIGNASRLRAIFAAAYPNINDERLRGVPDKVVVTSFLKQRGAFFALPATPVGDTKERMTATRSQTDNFRNGHILMHEPTFVVPDLTISGDQLKIMLRELGELCPAIFPTQSVLHALYQHAVASSTAVLQGKALVTGSTITSPNGSTGVLHIGDVAPTGFKMGIYPAMTSHNISQATGLSGLLTLAQMSKTPVPPATEVAQKTRQTLGFALRIAPST